jgi:acyl carrier protein
MELLDVEAEEIRAQSYLVRDLGVESIDFLELAVALNQRFHIEVHDDTVFLRNLRLHLSKASQGNADDLEYLKGAYGFLAEQRLREILSDLDGGPVIQVRDLVEYVQWKMTGSKAA